MVIFKTNDEMVADFLFMYCEGKSALWRMFFGWRETKGDEFTFKVPRRIYKMAEGLASNYGYEISFGY